MKNQKKYSLSDILSIMSLLLVFIGYVYSAIYIENNYLSLSELFMYIKYLLFFGSWIIYREMLIVSIVLFVIAVVLYIIAFLLHFIGRMPFQKNIMKFSIVAWTMLLFITIFSCCLGYYLENFFLS